MRIHKTICTSILFLTLSITLNAQSMLSVTPTSRNVPYTSGSITFTINCNQYKSVTRDDLAKQSNSPETMASAGWTATSNAGWMSVSPSSGSSYPAIIKVSFTVNSGGPRSGIVTVTAPGNDNSPVSVSVNQAAAPNILYVNPSSFTFPSSGGSGQATVSGSWQTPTGVTASDDQSWITTSVSGTAITIMVGSNSGAGRYGTITVNASNVAGTKTITVFQEAASPILCVNPTYINLPSSSGSGCILVSNCGYGTMTWAASASCSWLSITSGSSGTGNGYVCFSYPANSGPSRYCTLSIYCLETDTTVQVQICQADSGLYKTENVNELPSEYSLKQNFPNPFNPTTIISYRIPEAGNVSLKVFDIMGKEVASLVDGYKEPRNYNVEFNASNLSSGIYFYELRVNKYYSVKKLLVTK